MYTKPMNIIETKDLTKIYTSGLVRRSSVRALDGVSLSVNPGEIYSLLGPNGAGKTTFIRILLSITFQTSGEAFILNRPVRDHRVKEKVGYLPENHRYPAHLSGEGVLRYFGKLSGLNGNVLDSQTEELLRVVNMTQWRKMKIRKYSKGMLQRIGLAQALINDPELIFLDEPTDGVDPVGRREIRDILRRLRDRGKTVFLNSHMLSEVELISDRIAILSKGKVVRTGRVDDFTLGKKQFEIQIDGSLSDTVLEAIRSMDPSVRKEDDALVLSVDDRNTINEVIDLLRSNGIFVQSMAPRRITLEDSFIDLIAERDKQ
jgi:ABC-2 type transport system ATP-binding protein